MQQLNVAKKDARRPGYLTPVAPRPPRFRSIEKEVSAAVNALQALGTTNG
jgi:hypothetical protein